jgi:hypothetical protein
MNPNDWLVVLSLQVWLVLLGGALLARNRPLISDRDADDPSDDEQRWCERAMTSSDVEPPNVTRWRDDR